MRIMADPNCWVRDLEWYVAIIFDSLPRCMQLKIHERFAASAIFSTLYDWPPLKPEAPVIKQMLNFIARATNAGTPGNFFVEFFPVTIPEFTKRIVFQWHTGHLGRLSVTPIVGKVWEYLFITFFETPLTASFVITHYNCFTHYGALFMRLLSFV